MNLRKITSMTALVSFVLEMITSIILYIVPHGSVTYWSDWRFWGLSKTQWSDLHINLGVLFLLAIVLQTYYNWNDLISYLRNKSNMTSFFSGNLIVSMALSIIFSVGTLYEIPSFSSV